MRNNYGRNSRGRSMGDWDLRESNHRRSFRESLTGRYSQSFLEVIKLEPIYDMLMTLTKDNNVKGKQDVQNTTNGLNTVEGVIEYRPGNDGMVGFAYCSLRVITSEGIHLGNIYLEITFFDDGWLSLELEDSYGKRYVLEDIDIDNPLDPIEEDNLRLLKIQLKEFLNFIK